MSKHRFVHVSFWQDSFVLDLSPEEKYFYLYLMTNSKTSQIGIYELPKRVVELETGYNRETVDKLLNRFIEYGKIQYNDTTKEIMLINWVKHNWNSSPNVLKHIAAALKEVKHEDFIKEYLKQAAVIEDDDKKIRLISPLQAPYKPLGESMEQTKLKKKETKEKEKEKLKPQRETDIRDLVDYYEKHYTTITGPSVVESFEEKLDKGFTKEAILKAYEIGKENDKKENWYINGIFKNWDKAGTYTLEEINAAEKKRATSKAGKDPLADVWNLSDEELQRRYGE
ncbi:DnaD domain-containing protein [Salinicoccus halodurans]|uniref:Phage replication protein, DnaD domain n=1 Tax=Salinicoccus halodurans TaxID=407035 RepID=A0AA94KXP5_9STAP|nr:DnaD domain protein [Salinicoccus halodurans]SFK95225.1 Phage replication protein, DnaD domain [Salinicoccus halodurans]